MSTSTPVGTLSLSQIGQISITAHDIERAIRFYRDTLGVPFLFQAGTLAFFMCHGVRLMVAVPETSEYDHPSSVLYFKVDDIHAAHDALQARGVAFLGAPHVIHKTPQYELWMAFFRDSEGNTMALMHEQPLA